MVAIPMPTASLGFAMVTGRPSKRILPGVGGVDPRHHLDQGGLAGAVVPDQRHDLAGPHVEVDAVEGVHRAEALGHALDGEDRAT